MAGPALLDHVSAFDEPRFPGLKPIATVVDATVERNGAVTTARRYLVSSLTLDARTLARAVRAHRGIENRLHRVLDVVFHDDLVRLRANHGPKNMATIKHMAMNLIRSAAGKDSLVSRVGSAYRCPPDVARELSGPPLPP